MVCPSPSIQPGELPPSGITLQDGLWEFPLSPDTHSWSLTCLLAVAQPGLSECPWGSAFPRCQKVPGSLFEPLTPPLNPPRPGWELLGGTQTPLLWVFRGAMEPAGPRLSPVGVLSTPSPPPSPPVPSTQFSRHYPMPPRSIAAWGAGDALWGGARPYLPNTPPRAAPSTPTRSPSGRDGLLLPLPEAREGGVGSPGSRVTPCISV